MNKNPLDAMDRFVALLDAPEPSFARVVERRARRRRRRQMAAGAGATTTLAGFVAAMVWVLPLGTDPSPDAINVASSDRAATAPATTEPAVVEPALQPPVEFTACNETIDEAGVIEGHEETITIATPEGDMTVDRYRGTIVPQIMSAISDPRLDGSWTLAWNEDDYQGPGAPSGSIVTIILRIENDEGAWQGTDTIVRLPGVDDFLEQFQVMLTGEGAYEGLTAAMAWWGDVGVNSEAEPCPNVRGYIIDGGVPEAEGTFPAP